MGDDAEVHPELALELVRKLRRRGGGWRLIQTGAVVTSPVWLLIGMAEAMPILALVGAGASALLGRNLVQNARSIDASKFLALVDGLPKPLRAEMNGRMLRIGNAGLARDRWAELKISAHEERQLRELALPTARIHRDD